MNHGIQNNLLIQSLVQSLEHEEETKSKLFNLLIIKQKEREKLRESSRCLASPDNLLKREKSIKKNETPKSDPKSNKLYMALKELDLNGNITIYFSLKDSSLGNLNNVAKVEICGCLTRNQLYEMEPLNNENEKIYFIDLKVQPGFKYWYNIYINKIESYDLSAPSEFSLLKKIRNIVFVVKKINEDSINSLSRMKSFQNIFTNALTRMNSFIKPNSELSDSNSFFEENQSSNIYYNYKGTPGGIFKVVYRKPEIFSVGLQRITDPNGIFIDQNKTRTKPVYIYFSELEKKYEKIPILEEEKYEMGTIIRLTVFVKVEVDEHTQRKFCHITSIRPPNINLNDYTINFDKSNEHISEIYYHYIGHVCFRSITVNESCGYVLNSTIIAYSSMFQKVFNLIHMHINDTSESISFELFDSTGIEDPNTVNMFTKDKFGNPLRYKVIVSNNNVKQILYNTGKNRINIPFKEIKIILNKFYKIRSNLSNDLKIVKVFSMPIGILPTGNQIPIEDLNHQKSIADKLFECQERFPQEIEGLVDIEIIYSNNELKKNPEIRSVPVCMLEELNQNEEKEIEDLIKNSYDERIKESITKAKIFQNIILEISLSSAQMNVSEMEEAVQKIIKMESEINESLEGLEIDEDFKAYIYQLRDNAMDLNRKLATEARNLKI